MSVALRRSRTISFRMSPEEYEGFAQLCYDRGVSSISDMARIALYNFIATDRGVDPLAVEVRDLRSQLKAMTNELERIAEVVEARKASKANG